jgi:transcriptional regulator with XRE-family HTH domain
MTRNEFGDIDPKTIARIEQGKIKKPRISTLGAIATILGVRRDELGDY